MSILSRFFWTTSIIVTATTTGMPSSVRLCGQIEVALKISPVHNVQNDIGALGDQVISRHNLFQRVRGERVNAGRS